MATVATNKLWAYIESLSLSKRDRSWLAGKLLEPMHDADPYEVSPSGDKFFADSRNVKAVEEDIRRAHSPQAKFTRLESKEDVMSFINSLYVHSRVGSAVHSNLFSQSPLYTPTPQQQMKEHQV